ncbi:MAG: hypothetical protein IJS29_10585 [Selenomonadaceae bacterium]|nr:hypothetical protein [Selenomonadaceae bacterium]
MKGFYFDIQRFDNVTLTDGDDKYQNFVTATIDGGAGNDSISNNGYGASFSSIYGGSGNDTITNMKVAPLR